MNKIKKSILALAVLAGTLPVLSACNTFAGVVEDLQRGGAAIAREADRR